MKISKHLKCRENNSETHVPIDQNNFKGKNYDNCNFDICGSYAND